MSLRLDAELIAQVVEGKLYGTPAPVKGISIDSRTIREGELFIALKGEKHDAHDFVMEAFKRGGAGALVERDIPIPEGKFCIKVKDTLRALREIANFQRSRYKGKVIGVAGSAGKTTTKELIHHLLSHKEPAYRSKGNLNSQIGLPLVLANLDLDTKFTVLELGASQRGDVAKLTKLAKPHVRVITTIGEEHLQTFGTLEDVIEGNGEILMDFTKDSFAVLPVYLKDRFKIPKNRVLTFGKGGDIEATDVEVSIQGVSFTYEGKTFHTPVISISLVENILASFGVLKALGYNPSDFVERLKTFKGAPGRMQVIRRRGIFFIDDTYNANPPSMKNALKTLAKLNTQGRKIAVLGDMLELGKYSEMLHREIGKLSSELGIDLVLFYGKEMLYAYEEAVKSNKNRFYFNNSEDLINFLLKECREGNIILFKGSRGVKMEVALGKVMERLDANA